MKPCRRCGGPKAPGAGRRYCDPCDKYCRICGERERPGNRQHCTPCSSALSAQGKRRRWQDPKVKACEQMRTRFWDSVYRGKINLAEVQTPCAVCGAQKVEMYLPEPLPEAMLWLCREHHIAMRKAVRLGRYRIGGHDIHRHAARRRRRRKSTTGPKGP